MMLKTAFSIRNTSKHTWDDSILNLELKQKGKVVLTDIQVLSSLTASSEARRESTFFLKSSLYETSSFNLDVFYTFNGEKCAIARDIPVEFKVQKLSEAVRCELVRVSYDPSKSDSGDDIFVPRVDYRVRNIRAEPLGDVQLRFVWMSLGGELLNQGMEYVVGFNDLPLAPQQTKTGFALCGVGYAARVPVKVDIYLEDGQQRWALYKGVLVR
jgi:hypothetical protein